MQSNSILDLVISTFFRIFPKYSRHFLCCMHMFSISHPSFVLPSRKWMSHSILSIVCRFSNGWHLHCAYSAYKTDVNIHFLFTGWMGLFTFSPLYAGHIDVIFREVFICCIWYVMFHVCFLGSGKMFPFIHSENIVLSTPSYYVLPSL